METAKEVSPGEVWVSRHGKHQGLRVQIEKDRGASIKVKVLRTPGVDHDMVGRYWTIPRDIFYVRYGPLVENSFEPKVKTAVDEVILEAMVRNELNRRKQEELEISRQIENAQNGVTEVQAVAPSFSRAELATKNFHTQEARDKRAATLQARVDALGHQDIEEIRKLHNMGEPLAEICRAYHLDAASVTKVLYMPEPVTEPTPIKSPHSHPQTTATRALIARGTRAAIDKQFREMSPETKAQIVQDRLSGLSYFLIMKKYGIINGVVTKVLHEAGYKGYGKNSKIGGQSPPEVQPQPEATGWKSEIGVVPIMAADPRVFKAHVVVSKPVETYIEVEAATLAEAIQLAEMYPGVSHVFGVREERGTTNSSRMSLERK